MFKYDVGDTVYYILQDIKIVEARVINCSDAYTKYALLSESGKVIFEHFNNVFNTKKLAQIMLTERKKKFKGSKA